MLHVGLFLFLFFFETCCVFFFSISHVGYVMFFFCHVGLCVCLSHWFVSV